MNKVRIPATTANLGAGFDCLGIALNLYNEIAFQPCDTFLIECEDDVPKDDTNLIIQAAVQTFESQGKVLSGLHIIQKNHIPMARGLGSSSACIVGGIAIANFLMGNPLSLQEQLNLANKIEGHPDNVAPALLGGFIAAVAQKEKVFYQRCAVDNTLAFLAVVPDFMLHTAQARQVLPRTISREDAIFNLSRSALCTAAFYTKDYGLLSVATQDRLHQDYRLPLIEGGQEILSFAQQLDIYSATVSGAGPTLMIVMDKNKKDVLMQIQNYIQNSFPTYTILQLQSDNQGVHIF